MNNKGKKVICINGDRSKLYTQVIFIMKDNELAINTKEPIDFVSEAEKIINGYVNQNEDILKNETNNTYIEENEGIQQLVIRKSKSMDIMLNALILVSCVGLSLLLLYLQK